LGRNLKFAARPATPKGGGNGLSTKQTTVKSTVSGIEGNCAYLAHGALFACDYLPGSDTALWLRHVTALSAGCGAKISRICCSASAIERQVGISER
jgi:hypothetical protein